MRYCCRKCDIMIVPVRWCITRSRGFLDILNPENYLEPPRFSGMVSGNVNEMMEMLHRNLPFSVNRSESNFDFIARPDHPCLQAASFNITDIPLEFYIYPLNIDLDKVYPYQQVTEDTVVIITAYNLTTDIVRKDIASDYLKIFDTTTWSLTVAYLILFGLVLDLSTKMLTHRRINPFSSCFEVFSQFIEKGQNQVHGWSRRTLLVILAIFSFYILNYFSNYIKTESTVRRDCKRPTVINDYRDLFEAKPPLDLYGNREIQVIQEFREAREGSYAAKLAKRIRFPMGSANPFIRTLSRMKRRETALILQRTLSEFAVSTYVRSFLGDEEGQNAMNIPYRMWRSSDPSAKTRLMGLVMRTEFMRTNVFGKVLSKRIRRIHENGISSRFIEKLDEGVDLTGRNPPHSFIREMTRKDLVICEVEETPQTHLGMLTGLFNAFCFICLFAMFIVCLERYAHPITVHRPSQCNRTNISSQKMRAKNDQRMRCKSAPILVGKRPPSTV